MGDEKRTVDQVTPLTNENPGHHGTLGDGEGGNETIPNTVAPDPADED